MVAVARGVSLGAKVLVLDEPTSSLTDREVTLLYALIRTLQAQGTAVVYISHRFDELYAICDRVTVLRDGKLVATRPLAGLERLDLVCLMLGKSREALAAGHTTAFHGVPRERPAGEAPLLRAEGLRRGQKLRGVSRRGAARRDRRPRRAARLRPQRDRARHLRRRPRGRAAMEMRGRAYAPHGPTDAIGARVGFVSEDRKAEGIIPELSVRENLTLAALPTLTRLGVVDDREAARDRRRVHARASASRRRAPTSASASSRAATSRRCCSRAGCARAPSCSSSTSRRAASTSARAARSRRW